MKNLYTVIISLFLLTTFSCTNQTVAGTKESNSIEKAIGVLKEKNIAETNEGMLILKRYEFYLSQLLGGNAYTDWRGYSNPPIYNPTIFMRMMDSTITDKIVQNTIKGKDAFDGITGFFERAYVSSVDKSLDSYLVYVPNTFDPAKKYPLVVMLHGYGDSAHINPYSPVHFDILKACEKRGVILVSPCGRQKLPSQRGFYIDDAETDVLQVISLVKKYYPIDEKRVYITGNSMGGFGTYWIGSRHPGLFAAVAPVCGMWSGIMSIPKVDLDKFADLPVFIIHNDLDETVPVSESRNAYEYLKKIGADVRYSEIRVSRDDPWDYGIFHGHNAWDYAYQDTELIDWFLKYEKQ
jgi:predicted peptidase